MLCQPGSWHKHSLVLLASISSTLRRVTSESGVKHPVSNGEQEIVLSQRERIEVGTEVGVRIIALGMEGNVHLKRKLKKYIYFWVPCAVRSRGICFPYMCSQQAFSLPWLLLFFLSDMSALKSVMHSESICFEKQVWIREEKRHICK